MKDNPNLVRECYTHDTGGVPELDQRAFMDWCEAHVSEWKALVERMGLDWPRWTIPEDYHGKKTYHEWLKERVGLCSDTWPKEMAAKTRWIGKDEALAMYPMDNGDE